MTVGIVCVNSTLAGQRAAVADDVVSPLHRWGFDPRPYDRVLVHRLTRPEIVLRARIGGLDPWLATRVVAALARGWRRFYLVTPLDVLAGVPWFRRAVRSAKFVTWVWTRDDVLRHRRVLDWCEHVFCLTDAALDAAWSAGFGQRASVQLWGADPAWYAGDAIEPDFEVALLGQTNRDLATAFEAARLGAMRVATTERVLAAGGMGSAGGLLPGVRAFAPRTQREVVQLFRRARVSWVPLLPSDPMPSGYTNVVESLLVGTPVVIGDTTSLPRRLLELPGVFTYRSGEARSLLERTREALAWAALDTARRARLRELAAVTLDAGELRRTLHGLLA